MGMERINIDLKKGVVKYPITKTHAAGEGEPVITDTPVVIDPTVIFDSTMVMDLITDVTKITNANVVFDVTKITDATMVLDFTMVSLISDGTNTVKARRRPQAALGRARWQMRRESFLCRARQ